MAVISCPVCGPSQMEKTHIDGEPGHYVEEVWIPAREEDNCDHAVTISYGLPAVDEVRDSDGELVPDYEWGYRL